MTDTAPATFIPSAADVAPAPAASTTPVQQPSFQELIDVPGVGDVELSTATKAAAPKFVQSADGNWHLVLTWTTKTKAHVAGVVAGILGAAEVASTYLLPAGSQYTHWLQIGVGVVGAAAAWLGVNSATNVPKQPNS